MRVHAFNLSTHMHTHYFLNKMFLFHNQFSPVQQKFIISLYKFLVIWCLLTPQTQLCLNSFQLLFSFLIIWTTFFVFFLLHSFCHLFYNFFLSQKEERLNFYKNQFTRKLISPQNEMISNRSKRLVTSKNYFISGRNDFYVN